MCDQVPPLYCPEQCEFVKQKPATAACQLSPEGTCADALSTGHTRGQPGIQAAGSQPKPVRLPDAPLAIRKMPSAGPIRAASATPTSKPFNQLAATFEEQPALPLRPTPSSGPAWKRIARPAPVLAKKDNPSLLSRLSKLTSAGGPPVPSRHVAGVVPPQSPASLLCFSVAASQQALQATQQRQKDLSNVTAYHQAWPDSQQSPQPSRQSPPGVVPDHEHRPNACTQQVTGHPLHSHPSATVVAQPAKPDRSAAQSMSDNHHWTQDDVSVPTGGEERREGGGVERAHAPAPQPTPPSYPTEPEVKPKSTLRSRLRLQRPVAVTTPPDPPGPPVRAAELPDAAQDPASQPSHASPAAAELPQMRSLTQLPWQPVGRPPEHPSKLTPPLDTDAAEDTPATSGVMQSQLHERSQAGHGSLRV